MSNQMQPCVYVKGSMSCNPSLNTRPLALQRKTEHKVMLVQNSKGVHTVNTALLNMCFPVLDDTWHNTQRQKGTQARLAGSLTVHVFIWCHAIHVQQHTY